MNAIAEYIFKNILKRASAADDLSVFERFPSVHTLYVKAPAGEIWVNGFTLKEIEDGPSWIVGFYQQRNEVFKSATATMVRMGSAFNGSIVRREDWEKWDLERARP